MSTTDHAAVTRRWKPKLATRRALRAYAVRQHSYWLGAVRASKPGTARRQLANSMLVKRASKLAVRNSQVRYAERVLARHRVQPLNERAYEEAVQVNARNVLERGGNNRGPEVEKLIREGGGLAGQAWCGWAMAAIYKRAGSKAPSWHWGAVRLYVPLSGIKVTSYPKIGNLVRFTFDHIGMFIHYCDANGKRQPRDSATHIKTFEGNTGDSGAVSDSAGGGDGFKQKIRHRSLVRDYLSVTR